MLEMTLLATSAIGATLLVAAAVLPTFAKSRDGDASATPSSMVRSVAPAPVQGVRAANNEGRPRDGERSPQMRDGERSLQMRNGDRHDGERKDDQDKADD